MSDSSSLIRYNALVEGDEPSLIDRLMATALADPGILSLAAGFTDNACMPAALIGTAVEGLLAQGDSSIFQYGSNQGRPGLRSQVIKQLRAEPQESVSSWISGDNVLIGNGSQQVLYLALQSLCDPGSILLVQSPTYFVFLEAARGLGIEVRSLPCDPWGRLEIEALPEFLQQLKARGDGGRVRGCYLVSYFSNPSTHTMTVEEKLGLLAALGSSGLRVPIIEDAAYRDLWFARPPEVPSFLTLSSDTSWPILYLCTFTKAFSTGLKVGMGIFSDAGWMRRCARIKSHQDFGTANFTQAVIEFLIELPEWGDFQARMRRHYAAKCTAFHKVLATTSLGKCGWEWRQPEGGLLLWAVGPEGLDTGMGSPMFAAARKERVLYVPGQACQAEGVVCSSVRLSFGALAVKEFPEAVERFSRAAVAGACP